MRTIKVVELLISVAMVHCRGTPSSRVAASVCTVALTASGSCCFRYRYALQQTHQQFPSTSAALAGDGQHAGNASRFRGLPATAAHHLQAYGAAWASAALPCVRMTSWTSQRPGEGQQLTFPRACRRRRCSTSSCWARWAAGPPSGRACTRPRPCRSRSRGACRPAR